MNKLFFLFLAGILLTGCATTSSISPISIGNNTSVIMMDTDMKIPILAPLNIENRAVSLLNQLFNIDAANKNMILVVSNDSDCDFTMDILGQNSYSLPVSAKKSESIVLEQGEYEIRSTVCQSPYKVFRTFSENTELNIKYSIVKIPDANNVTAKLQ
ncbi:MAG: hypothetical protein DI529_02230 [Chryseobacterium sp.]|nr:MAG: hypothetical protein DI529_02230 [Chryseobacterium sp.]